MNNTIINQNQIKKNIKCHIMRYFFKLKKLYSSI